MTEAEINRLLQAYGSGETPKRSLAQRAGDIAHDVGKSVESGLTRGVVGIPGAPADIVRFGQMARDYLRSTNIGGPSQGTFDDVRKRRDLEREEENIAPLRPSTLEAAGSQAMVDRLDPISGGALKYEPTTAAGRAVALPSEMAGGAVVGGMGGGARGAIGAGVRQGIIPGAAVTGAQALGVQNPVALGALGIAAAGVAEGARTRSAPEALQRRTEGVTQAHLQQAEELFQAAQARGLPLTRGNALDYVTGGQTNVSGLQRVVEGQGNDLREFYANTAPRTAAATGQALDQIAPMSAQPSTIGPRAATAMAGELGDVNRDINRATRPLYQAIDPTPVPAAEFQALMGNPLFARTHTAVMGNPEYAHLTQGMAPDSVGAVDLTRRILAQGETQRSNPVAPNWDPTASTGYGMAAGQAQDVASDASRIGQPAFQQGGPLAGGPSPLELAQQTQAAAREARLDPLQHGPEGRVAAASTTEGVQRAMFPADPLEGSHTEVARAITTLARRNPQVAPDLVRNYLGSEFARIQDVAQSGPGDFTGPAFARQVMGNPQQARNLTAALAALPNGPERAQTFHQTMRIFEAMGRRERIGSQTAFNSEELARLRGAGFSEGALKLLGGGGLKIPQAAWDTIENWRLGRNTQELASLFTDPARGAEFAAIARAAPGSTHQTALLLRVLGRGAPVSATVRQDEERQRKAGAR